MKVCKRCGVAKPEDQFRDYYKQKGKYSFCKECERIESRRKYLVKLGSSRSPEQDADLVDIQRLYKVRAQAGLQVPSAYKPPVSTIVQKYLEEAENENV